ncbi:unnamed protein product [Prorocentrum cordatum]|uniref:Uncharacterized protein n=1 Tax=Prorocentrum cordatum TaxID=2364126 RepID=A0ABN9UCE9_9DINO|nr:unnamed protein product [Polarella glacialis]
MALPFAGPPRAGRGAMASQTAAPPGGRRHPFRHAVSLGLRCVTAKVFQDAGLRRYATPFDWVFCSMEMVTHCIQDHCAELLRREAYWEVATIEDVVRSPNAIADLTPRGIHARGVAQGRPERRVRVLIGHSAFSPMQRGVGKDVIFNHSNPMEAEGYEQLGRQARRLGRVLDLREEPKLFVIANINRQLWDLDGVVQLFEALRSRSANFMLLAVNLVLNKEGLPAEGRRRPRQRRGRAAPALGSRGRGAAGEGDVVRGRLQRCLLLGGLEVGTVPRGGRRRPPLRPRGWRPPRPPRPRGGP